MNLPIVTAADGAAWESSLLVDLAAGTSRLSVVRRCVDVVELIAVAASGQARGALVDARLRGLNGDVVDRLTAAGIAVVGVTSVRRSDGQLADYELATERGSYNQNDGAAADADDQRLSECGVRFSVPADVTAQALITVLDTAIADLATPGAVDRLGYADPGQASLVTAGSGAAGRGELIPTGTTGRTGSVIAVWGPTGAPGRSVVAANLATELAGLGQSCLLIDADVYGGVVANLFGLLDESPGLVAACRQAQRRRLDPAGLAGLCWQINSQLRVLTGIVRADRWPELRPSAIETVLETSRALVDFTVLDLGFGLETDEELSFDTVAPRRNGATLAALAVADLVLVVGSADPIGLQRLVKGLDELREVEPPAPSWVVLNRVRESAVPGATRAQLQETLRRFTGRTAAVLLPFDIAALDHAIVGGTMLAESAPSSSLRHELTGLAAAIAGVAVPVKRRRRR